ncbi:MAG: sigma-54-dependent Fis family transcriptional regulator [Acidobacteria bacterium]|nr:sigma-54-dependent Fis family transcriptional regulator [Acidobacteriota bacterium]MCB9396879.1 sigma-54-dependent Fis family transcriptional regulator [Acidobacteriota bacterium]
MDSNEVNVWAQKVAAWIKNLNFLDSQHLPPSLAQGLPDLTHVTPAVLEQLETQKRWKALTDDLLTLEHSEKQVNRWYFWTHFAHGIKTLTDCDAVQVFFRGLGGSKWMRLNPLGEDELETTPDFEETPEGVSVKGNLPEVAQHAVRRWVLDGDHTLLVLCTHKLPFPRIKGERLLVIDQDLALVNLLVARHFSPLEMPINPTKPTAQSLVPRANRPILGEDERFLAALESIEKAANSEATVFIHGESGTGKELFAKHLHQNSPRSKGPFIAINCSAIPSELIESEMFGHEKGSFTGAYYRKIGRVEQANSGTLFLDEIGEMPLAFQAKLLRYLQEKTFTRVGGNQTIHSDARIVVATHRDLKHLVEKGRFREDLYYRVHVIPVVIPSLRERGKDLHILAETFFQRFISKSRASRRTVDPLVYDCLEHYHWPGNVRELENVIQRTVVMASGEQIELRDLPEEIRKSATQPIQPTYRLHPFEKYDTYVPTDRDSLNDLKREVEHLAQTYSRDLERRFLMQLLESVGNSPRKAAEQAGINRTLFYKLLKRAGVDVGILSKEDT